MPVITGALNTKLLSLADCAADLRVVQDDVTGDKQLEVCIMPAGNDIQAASRLCVSATLPVDLEMPLAVPVTGTSSMPGQCQCIVYNLKLPVYYRDGTCTTVVNY